MDDETVSQPLTQVQTGNDTLIMTGDFPALAAATMFDYWTKPELLKLWWSPEAEVEPKIGGTYHLSWPQPNWHLLGNITNYEPGRSLAFTWKWSQEPDLPTREVEVTIHHREQGGTRLTIIHEPYGDSAREQEDRQSHIEGWQYFCGRLQGVKANAS